LDALNNAVTRPELVGGEIISPETANTAQNVLADLAASGVREPHVMPGYGGSVLIEWHTVDGDVELRVRGNGVQFSSFDATTGMEVDEVPLGTTHKEWIASRFPA
jgi:hypothetical protein